MVAFSFFQMKDFLYLVTQKSIYTKMKKVLFILSLGGFMALTACKKNYTCTVNLLGIESVIEYNDLNKAEAKDGKASCEDASGTWAPE